MKTFFSFIFYLFIFFGLHLIWEQKLFKFSVKTFFSFFFGLHMISLRENNNGRASSPPMLKMGQNWGEIANYPSNALHKSAPLTTVTLSCCTGRCLWMNFGLKFKMNTLTLEKRHWLFYFSFPQRIYVKPHFQFQQTQKQKKERLLVVEEEMRVAL